MRPSIFVGCILVLLLHCQSYAGTEELIFFADDHYKVLGGPELQASAINPVIEPGKSSALMISLANNGVVEELIPINGNGSEADIALEIEEEQRSVDAQNITASLLGDDDISVTSGPCHIDSIPAGSVAQMEFNLSAAETTSGWHDLLLTVDYEHQMDTSVNEGVASPLYLPDNLTQVLRVRAQESEGSIRILGVKSDISPGRRGTIWAVVKSSGKDVLRNCTLKLLAASPFHPAETNCNLGDIMPGATAVAEFKVDVDGDAGLQEYRLACEVLHEDGKAVLAFPVTLKAASGPGYLPMIAILVIIASAAAFILIRNRKMLRRRRPRR